MKFLPEEEFLPGWEPLVYAFRCSSLLECGSIKFSLTISKASKNLETLKNCQRFENLELYKDQF